MTLKRHWLWGMGFFIILIIHAQVPPDRPFPKGLVIANSGSDERPDASGALVIKDSVGFFPGSCGFRYFLGMAKVYKICFFGKEVKALDWASTFGSPLGKKAFRLRLDFLRSLRGKQVAAAFSDQLNKNPTSQKLEKIERERFVAWAAKLKPVDGSVMDLSFNDSKVLKVTFREFPNQGGEGAVFESDQIALARSVAGIWFGEKPLNERLKLELMK